MERLQYSTYYELSIDLSFSGITAYRLLRVIGGPCSVDVARIGQFLQHQLQHTIQWEAFTTSIFLPDTNCYQFQGV